MYSAAEDTAERDNPKALDAELNPNNHPNHRTNARDVEQLNEEILPFGQGKRIHAVSICNGWRGTIIGTKEAFDKTAVGEITEDEGQNAKKKEEHGRTYCY